MPKQTDNGRVAPTPLHLDNGALPIQPVGSRIAVRCVFDGVWSRGFVVDEVLSDDGLTCYRVKRGDGSVLPAMFTQQDVAPDHR